MTFDSFVKLPEGIIYLVMGLANLVTGMIQVVSIHNWLRGQIHQPWFNQLTSGDLIPANQR